MGLTSLNSKDDSSSGGNVEQIIKRMKCHGLMIIYQQMDWIQMYLQIMRKLISSVVHHLPQEFQQSSIQITLFFQPIQVHPSKQKQYQQQTNQCSIERLCDSIAKTSYAMFSSPSCSNNNDGMSQLVSFHFFQHQMQNQDPKIGEIKKMVKKMVKHNKKDKKHKRKQKPLKKR